MIDFSKDMSAEIASRYGAKVYQLDRERTKAKNFGLRNAKGKYVLFVDLDMELTKRVVEECVILAEKDDKIGGIIMLEISKLLHQFGRFNSF